MEITEISQPDLGLGIEEESGSKMAEGNEPQTSGWKSDMQAGIHLGKILDRIQHIEGMRAAEVFKDFLEITELALMRLPAQFNAATRTGQLEAVDPPDIAARWKAVANRYKKPAEVISCFGEGLAYLLDKSVTEEGDIT